MTYCDGCGQARPDVELGLCDDCFEVMPMNVWVSVDALGREVLYTQSGKITFDPTLGD